MQFCKKISTKIKVLIILNLFTYIKNYISDNFITNSSMNFYYQKKKIQYCTRSSIILNIEKIFILLSRTAHLFIDQFF